MDTVHFTDTNLDLVRFYSQETSLATFTNNSAFSAELCYELFRWIKISNPNWCRCQWSTASSIRRNNVLNVLKYEEQIVHDPDALLFTCDPGNYTKYDNARKVNMSDYNKEKIQYTILP